MTGIEAEKYYLLLVEDNEDDELLIIRAFGKYLDAGRIKVVRDGVEAVAFLEDSNTRNTMPRAIILDINLPRKNGKEVLKAIRLNERTKYLPVVMLTSSDEPSDLVDSYNLGANSYIRKPVNYQDFVRVIDQVGSYWLHLNHPLHN